MKPIVIYHKNCVDGAMSAAIAYLKFKDQDVSEIAKKYGGGGYPGSAGLPWA